MSVLSRVFEDSGLTTTAIALVRQQAEQARPPRALVVPFPLGYALGRPNDPDFQHRVIGAALELLKYPQGPVLVEFPENEGPDSLPQASDVSSSPAQLEWSPEEEVTTLRAFYQQWVENHQGRTAVGLTGMPQGRFHEIIRFLRSYAQGAEGDIKERPPEVSLNQYIRYCIDDLKAFCYEARLAQLPDAGEPDVHRWFWGETAVGQLVSDVAAHMNASDDQELKVIAFGIARLGVSPF